MSYIFLSRGDKSYFKKQILYNLQSALCFFFCNFIGLYFYLNRFFETINTIPGVLLFANFIIFLCAITLILNDIFSRTITGITQKSSTYFKWYKTGKGNPFQISLMGSLDRSSRVAYVEKNFDGFGKEILYNLQLCVVWVIIISVLYLIKVTWIVNR